MNPESLSPQEQLEKLQAELSSRRSIVHFAHAGVSLMWALILAGATIKLFIDSAKVPYLAFLAGLVTLGLSVYGLVHLGRGRRVMAEELVRFEKLKELRHQLKLDDPSALLPG